MECSIAHCLRGGKTGVIPLILEKWAASVSANRDASSGFEAAAPSRRRDSAARMRARIALSAS
ncbi:MAG TPA: hypothetical protein VIJ73_06000, partial [Methylomirabilota bacterium]